MKIGITYDLRDEYLAQGFSSEETAEFDHILTIEAIEDVLVRDGHEVKRIGNVKQLVSSLSAGMNWDIIFNIAEGVHGFGREAQVPALLDAFRIPYTFSDPLALSIALHKGIAKRVMQTLGVATAPFAIVERQTDLATITLPFPLFAKPVAEGSSKGISASSRVDSFRALTERCDYILRAHHQPALVERFLPGREFTVGILGTGRQATALGVMEVVLLDQTDPAVYSFANKTFYRERVRYSVARDPSALLAAELALRAWRGLGCRDGGRVDLRCDDTDQPHVLEVNPLPGLHPADSDLTILARLVGVTYDSVVRAILASAGHRAKRDHLLAG